jgi:hypothetical protein
MTRRATVLRLMRHYDTDRRVDPRRAQKANLVRLMSAGFESARVSYGTGQSFSRIRELILEIGDDLRYLELMS